MAEHAQIDIRKGKQLVRIHQGWGLPRLVLSDLRRVAGMGCKSARSVANKYIQQVKDASFGLSIITKDFAPDFLKYHYILDIETTPWTLTVVRSAGYRVVVGGDGAGHIGKKVPASKRTVLISAPLSQCSAR